MTESFKDTVITALRQEVLYLRNALKDRNEDIKRLLQLLQNGNIFEKEIEELNSKDRGEAVWKKEKIKQELDGMYYEKEYDYKTLKSKLLTKYAGIEEQDEKAKYDFGNDVIDSSFASRNCNYSGEKNRYKKGTIYPDRDIKRELSPSRNREYPVERNRSLEDLSGAIANENIYKDLESSSKDLRRGRNSDIKTIYEKGSYKMSKIMSKYRRNENEKDSYKNSNYSTKKREDDLKRAEARYKATTTNKYDLSKYYNKDKDKDSYKTTKSWTKIGNNEQKKDTDTYKSIYTSSRKLSPGRLSPTRKLSQGGLSPTRQISPRRLSPPRQLSPSRWSSKEKLGELKIDTDYGKKTYSRSSLDLDSTKLSPRKSEKNRREEIGKKYLLSPDYEKHFDSNARLNSYKKYSSSDDLNFRIKSDNVKCGICKFCDDDDHCSKSSKKYLDDFPIALKGAKGTRFEHDSDLQDQYVKFLDLKQKLAKVRSMDNVHSAASTRFDNSSRKGSAMNIEGNKKSVAFSRLDDLKEFENKFKRNNLKLKRIRSMDDLDRYDDLL